MTHPRLRKEQFRKADLKFVALKGPCSRLSSNFLERQHCQLSFPSLCYFSPSPTSTPRFRQLFTKAFRNLLNRYHGKWILLVSFEGDFAEKNWRIGVWTRRRGELLLMQWGENVIRLHPQLLSPDRIPNQTHSSTRFPKLTFWNPPDYRT